MNDVVPETEGAAAPETQAVENPGPETEDIPVPENMEIPDAEALPDHDPAAPAPLNVPRTPTGNADVDAALDRLGDADHLATDGHVEVYEDVHRGLRDALAGLDARPGPPAPTRHPTTTPQRGPSGHELNSSYGPRS